MLEPRFAFGNIRGVESVSFALSRGVSPSLCTVNILPGVVLDRRPHPMAFSDGQRSVKFSNCIITDVSPGVGADGSQSMVVSILDRRWMWRFPEIAGEYNIDNAGSIAPETKRSVRQLAGLCFERLGEFGVDLSALPDNVYPYTKWDFESAAAMLDDLCQQYNCHVCLTDRDQAKVYLDGYGKELPNLPSSSAEQGYDFGALPAYVGIVSAPITWEVDFKLLPAGIDRDGKVKPLRDMSLTEDLKKVPKAKFGWLSLEPGMNSRFAKESDRLYADTVYRIYLLEFNKELTEKGLVEAKDKLKSARQLLPVLDYRLEKKAVENDGIKFPGSDKGKDEDDTHRRLEPVIYGMFSKKNSTRRNNVEGDIHKFTCKFKGKPDLEAKPELVYEGKWEVDNDRGIVVFEDHVHANRPGDYDEKEFPSRVWPDLYLRVACNLHHPETRAQVRYERKLRINRFLHVPASELTDWTVQEDVEPELYKDWATEKVVSNVKDVVQQLDYYLGANVKKYLPKTPSSGTYPVLLPYSPDGKIAQVVFEIDGEGFIGTSIHKEIEGLSSIIDYSERRKQLAQQAALEQVRRNRNKRRERRKRRE